MDEHVGQDMNRTDGAGADEPVVYSTKRHWAVFFPPLCFLFLRGCLSRPKA